MLVVPCPAPIGTLVPAPITSMSLPSAATGDVSAFWAGDDYLVRQGGEWFRFIVEPVFTGATAESRRDAAEQALAMIPLGPGRVAFPVGSSGRTVYRVWRAGRNSSQDGAALRRGRIRILGVRAGRSLRRPA